MSVLYSQSRPGPEPAPMSDIMYHVNMSTCIHTCASVRYLYMLYVYACAVSLRKAGSHLYPSLFFGCV